MTDVKINYNDERPTTKSIDEHIQKLLEEYESSKDDNTNKVLKYIDERIDFLKDYSKVNDPGDVFNYDGDKFDIYIKSLTEFKKILLLDETKLKFQGDTTGGRKKHTYRKRRGNKRTYRKQRYSRRRFL